MNFEKIVELVIKLCEISQKVIYDEVLDMTYSTYADIFRPTIRKESLVYDIVWIIGATIFIALAAQIAIPVPFSPVPITGQSLAVLLTGILLGSKRGSLTVILYLLEGIAGLPVFAAAGFGLTHLVGPTGGYLIGFVPAAFLCGYLAEKGWDRNFGLALLTMIIGKIAIFVCGLLWLAEWVGLDQVLMMGLYPFLPGMVIKITLATASLPLGWKLVGTGKKE